MAYRVGFVPPQYVVDAIYESNFKRHNSAKRNYERMMYEFEENNITEESFGVMLDDEIRKIKQFNQLTC